VTGLPPFELHTPTTVEEASALLDAYGDEAALYAGGTELLLLLKLRFASFRHLIDVKGIEELQGIDAEDGTLRIGATATHREIESSEEVRGRWQALADMERGLANLRVRNAGTLGGNLCFADPHSDPATFLLVSDAELVARRGGAGARRIPVADFVRGAYRTALEPAELLVGVHVPAPAEGSATAHAALRFHERPAVTVTCLARVEAGHVAEARIAVGSVGPVPVRAREADALLVGLDAAAEGEELMAASAEAASASGAVDDAQGSAEYKRHLVGVLVRRTFAQALARAR
jgi:carbon-monoxide dehydrogenase medium subunit